MVMIRQQKSLIAGVSLMLLLIMGWTGAWAVFQEQTQPETLFPAETFLYVRYDGTLDSADAYAMTAEYDAFYNTGLIDRFTQLYDFMIARDDSGTGERVREAITDLLEKGFVLGASLPPGGEPGVPNVTLVFPQAGGWFQDAVQALKQMSRGSRIDWEEDQISGRDVLHCLIPQTPDLEFGLWQEGNHLVLTFGQGAIQTAIACADEKFPTLNSSERWLAVNNEEVDFEQNSLVWLNMEPVKNAFAETVLPVPTATGEPVTVQQILDMTGWNAFDQFVSRSGFKDDALWSESFLVGVTNGEKEPLTLEDLPPLPVKFTSLQVMQVDFKETYHYLIALAEKMAELNGPKAEQQLEDMLANLPEILGFDPEADLLDHLGTTLCIYDDANGGMFGTGVTACLSLKDPDAIDEFIDTQMARLHEQEEAEGFPQWPVYPLSIEKNDKTFLVFDLYDDRGQSVQMGAAQVVESWLVLSVMPQSIDALWMRLNGELPAWEPDPETAEILETLPSEFHGLTITNTRDTYQLVLNLLTTALPFIQKAALEGNFLQEGEELPFYIEDFPPAERVTAPLFPNISMTVADEQGARMISRASTYGIPGGNGSAGGVATVGVGTALLLPAVQQARAAARMAQAKNNLKLIGLAMHNFHDIHNHFPAATVENEALKPEERLSWVYSILPLIEQGALYEMIDQKAAWDEEGKNRQAASTWLPTMLDPNQGQPDAEEEYGLTHFAAMAGVGKDAPELKKGHERAGVFGYNRETTFRDITDGTSNTIMVTGVNKDLGPWAQGGKSTLRSLTKKPYINGPDGIGSGTGMVPTLFCDGSVRVISENIDAETLENLVKIADGNAIGEF